MQTLAFFSGSPFFFAKQAPCERVYKAFDSIDARNVFLLDRPLPCERGLYFSNSWKKTGTILSNF